MKQPLKQCCRVWGDDRKDGGAVAKHKGMLQSKTCRETPLKQLEPLPTCMGTRTRLLKGQQCHRWAWDGIHVFSTLLPAFSRMSLPGRGLLVPLG